MDIEAITTILIRKHGMSTVIETDTIHPLEQLSQQYQEADKKHKAIIRRQYADLAKALNIDAGFTQFRIKP
jgi:cobalamin biosynthesis Mg chelatase CobN